MSDEASPRKHSPTPCFVCGARWASRWTLSARFPDDELQNCFGLVGRGRMCHACSSSVYHYRRSNGRRTFFHVRDSRRHVTSRGDVERITNPSHSRPSKPTPKISPGPQVKKKTPERDGSSGVPRSTQTHASPLVTAVVRSSLSQQVLPGAAFMPDQSKGSSFSVGKKCSGPLPTTTRTESLLRSPEEPTSPVLIRNDGRAAVFTSTGDEQASSSAAFSHNGFSLQENGVFTNGWPEQSLQSLEDGEPQADASGRFSDEHRSSREDKTRRNSARSLVVHLQNGSTVPANLRRKRTEEWTAHDCACVLAMNGFVEEGDLFVEHEMDGVALKLISIEQLHSFLGLKVGKALRLANFLENLLRMWEV